MAKPTDNNQPGVVGPEKNVNHRPEVSGNLLSNMMTMR